MSPAAILAGLLLGMAFHLCLADLRAHRLAEGLRGRSRAGGEPSAHLLRRRLRRLRVRRGIEEDLPAAVELLALCTGVGMGFHQALEAVSRHAGPCLGPLFGEAIRRSGQGEPLLSALAALAGEAGSPGLGDLVRTLRLGEELGAPVARLMRQQEELLVERERLRIERRQGLLPTQLSVCSLFLLLPPTFVLLLLPHVLGFLGSGW